MFHGCRKSIFYVKDTGSHVFSEAYFILRDGSDKFESHGRDLASEAERIIKERENTGRKRRFPIGAILFLFGVILGIGVTVLSVILIV